MREQRNTYGNPNRSTKLSAKLSLRHTNTKGVQKSRPMKPKKEKLMLSNRSSRIVPSDAEVIGAQWA